MAYVITALSSAVEHDTTQGQFNKSIQIDATHYLNLWQGSGADGFAQIFELNASTGAITELGTALEFDTSDNLGIDAILFDGSNHVLVTWAGSGADGYAQILTVNLSTWAVTAEGTALEYDTDNGTHPTLAQIDSTHALLCYNGTAGDGFAQVLAVNTSTWAVTEPAAATEFDTGDYSFGSLLKVNNDDTRYILFHQGVSADGFVRILTVNTSTWAVTATSSSEHDTSNGTHNKAIQLDATHFLNVWGGGASATGKARVFSVNTTSWAVTGESTALEYSASAVLWNSLVLLTDDATYYYAVVAYSGADGDGFMQVLAVNKSTWEVTLSGSALEFDTTDGNYNSLVKVNTSRVINFWAGSGADGFVRAFDFVNQLPPTVVLNSPADAAEVLDTTPTLDFTGTDPNGESIEYNVQIDTVNTFNSQVAANPVYVGRTDLGSAGTGTSLSGSHTTTDHENRILLVTVTVDSGTPNDVNSVTYGGVALTQFAESGYGGNKNVSIWYLVAPAVGTGTVQVNTDDAYISAAAYDIYDVDQADPFCGSATGQNTNDTPTVNITTDTANALLLDILASNNAQANPDNGTLRFTKSFAFNETRGSTRQVTTATTYTMSYGTGAGDWAMAVVALKPASIPLLSKFSTTDAGFVNPDTGGDTHPFNSGENIQYTVQAGDALVEDTYYWRVKGADPTGSNNYGDWSSTRSFDVIEATIITDTRPARTYGKATTSANRGAITKGKVITSDNRGARIVSKQTVSDTRNARIKGYVTTSDNRPAITKGKVISSDNRPARLVSKQAVTDNRNARTKGVDTTSSARGAIIEGQVTTSSARNARLVSKQTVSDNRPARTKGKATTSDNRPARLVSKQAVNDNRSAKIHGLATTSSSRGAITEGQVTVSSARNARLVSKQAVSDTRPARTKGKVTTSDNRPARIVSKQTVSDNRPARTYGKITTSSNRPARLVSKETVSSSRNAKTHGKITTSSVRNARLVSKEAVSSVRNARLVSKDTVNATRNARTYGKVTDSSSRGARLVSKQAVSSNRPAKTHGKITTTDNRNARLVSKQTVSDTRNARTYGKITTSATRNAVTLGEITTTDTRNAKTHGKITTSNNRGARLVGKATGSDTRPARLVSKETVSSTRGAKLEAQIFRQQSSRNAKIHGKQGTSDTRGARMIGKNWNNENPQDWYQKTPTAYQTQNTNDWHEPDPKPFKTENNTDWYDKY